VSNINNGQSKMFESLVQVVNNMVDLHDPSAAGHQAETALLAKSIAQEMTDDEDLVNCVFLSGQMHDIGKIIIPSEILNAPGKLNRTQQVAIMRHPQLGYDMLSPIDFPFAVANVVVQHHERLDGSGYPLGLSGEAILLEARILAVADVVQAMITNRSYHPPFKLESVLDELDAHKGILYDAAVVDTYKHLVSKSHSTDGKLGKNHYSN
jgi:putative two-component system response regulator